MKRDQIAQLLGGYATGTLTDQEREALFAAALEDQSLYDALMNEEALRELLQDPAAHQRLLRALDAPKLSPLDRAWARLRQPAVWALAGGLAAAAVVAIVCVRPGGAPAPEKPMVARVDSAAQPQTARATGGAPPPRALLRKAPAAPVHSMQPVAALPPAAVSRPVIDYAVLRKNEEGALVAADSSRLHPGDWIQLRVEPQQSGQLTLSGVQETGVREVLYQQQVHAGNRYDIPPAAIQLGSEPGEQKLLLVLASSPPVALRGGLTAARTMALATDQTKAAAKESFVGLATPAPHPPQVTVEITLKYR
jgi:hypothetical protein